MQISVFVSKPCYRHRLTHSQFRLINTHKAEKRAEKKPTVWRFNKYFTSKAAKRLRNTFFFYFFFHDKSFKEEIAGGDTERLFGTEKRSMYSEVWFWKFFLIETLLMSCYIRVNTWYVAREVFSKFGITDAARKTAKFYDLRATHI